MVKKAIDTAKEWLETAEITLKARRYEQCLYSLEMAVEIALKSVLIELRVEVPRVHDIRSVAGTFLSGSKKVPKEFSRNLGQYLANFDTLLSLRSAVGYGFETGYDRSKLEKLAKDLFANGSEIIDACENAISHIKRNE